MTDLEKLKGLFDEWGVPYDSDGNDGAAVSVCVRAVGWYEPLKPDSPKADGYPGFYTEFEFTADGAFVKMGAWE